MALYTNFSDFVGAYVARYPEVIEVNSDDVVLLQTRTSQSSHWKPGVVPFKVSQQNGLVTLREVGVLKHTDGRIDETNDPLGTALRENWVRDEQEPYVESLLGSLGSFTFDFSDGQGTGTIVAVDYFNPPYFSNDQFDYARLLSWWDHGGTNLVQREIVLLGRPPSLQIWAVA